MRLKSLTPDMMEKIMSAPSVCLDGIDLAHYGVIDVKDVRKVNDDRINYMTYVVVYSDGSVMSIQCPQDKIAYHIRLEAEETEETENR